MKRKIFIANISKQIINLYKQLNIKCTIELYGSCALHNDIKDSDLDLVVNTKKTDGMTELNYIFKTIRKYLYKQSSGYEVHFIKYAKHPIIKIEGKVKMDISYGNRDGVEFVNYLENYNTLPMSLVLYISRIIKIWSRNRKLLPSNSHGMSNYCWLIIILFYANQYSDLFWFVASLDKDHFNYAISQILFIIFAEYYIFIYILYINSLTHVDWSIYTISQSLSAYKFNITDYLLVNNNFEYLNPITIEENEQIEMEEEKFEEEKDDDNSSNIDMNIASKISIENPTDRYVYYYIILLLHYIINNIIQNMKIKVYIKSYSEYYCCF